MQPYISYIFYTRLLEKDSVFFLLLGSKQRNVLFNQVTSVYFYDVAVIKVAFLRTSFIKLLSSICSLPDHVIQSYFVHVNESSYKYLYTIYLIDHLALSN